jgi:hypothetical protein
MGNFAKSMGNFANKMGNSVNQNSKTRELIDGLKAFKDMILVLSIRKERILLLLMH